MKPLSDSDFQELLKISTAPIGGIPEGLVSEDFNFWGSRLMQDKFANYVRRTYNIVITNRGREMLIYEQQRRNELPFRGPNLSVAQLLALKPKPNDVCESCEELIFRPYASVRCEYGSCIFNYADKDGSELEMGWSELLEIHVLYDVDKNPVYFRQPTHMCETCFERPHLVSLPELVSKGSKPFHIREKSKSRATMY